MTTLIIKSKIWNKSNIPLINYKEKNYIKQKITVEKTRMIKIIIIIIITNTTSTPTTTATATSTRTTTAAT